ncbi:hypothetical protein IM793_18725 [Pedobacter sp. MR2016-19]|uniref:hypothetical protein n=1 Tax=Pedobacter sp. MR2016-19 TaxID=2780089 RepID=UPI0018756FB4|nr:hypothetical protein [Pedobacter sp. MR2016-19]MBE5321205.1 hypothetical protein [Pedobacter sp. MR2016-19]
MNKHLNFLLLASVFLFFFGCSPNKTEYKMRILYMSTNEEGIPHGFSNDETIVGESDSIAYKKADKYFDLIKDNFANNPTKAPLSFTLYDYEDKVVSGELSF